MIKVSTQWGGIPHTINVKTLRFPGGEMHVTVQDFVPASEIKIRAHLPSSEDVMLLLLVTDALRRSYSGVSLILDMPYVPYARQDREANHGEPLSAKVFCDLINAQGYAKVIIQDPHSDVATALLDRVVVDDAMPALFATRDRIYLQTGIPKLALVAPDAGARKRVMKIAHALAVDVIFADKVRDTRTGAISGTEIQGELPDCPLLVVDDICDGGRTFTELATALMAKRASTLHPQYLYVTHGIFSKGVSQLLDGYAGIFARNNWINDSRVTAV